MNQTNKPQIEGREDIEHLVNTFYARIREDELLGPIFNHHIADEQWPAHLSKLSDFWETILFGAANFKGNPPKAHVNVDREANHSITQKHFGQWLMLWFTTIDELFEGQMAERAKQRARGMADHQFMVMWQNRPENASNQIRRY